MNFPHSVKIPGIKIRKAGTGTRNLKDKKNPCPMKKAGGGKNLPKLRPVKS
jgi:hypothetical protein